MFRAIETGLTRADEVEVLANLDPGTTIVSRGATMIRQGDRIRSAGAAGATKKAGAGAERRSASNQSPGAGSPPPRAPTTNAR